MRLRGAAGVLLCGLVLTGCTGSPSAPERPAGEPTGAGPAGWRPPAGAPEFCAVLAGATHIEDIPGAVGRLQVDPADPQQAWRLGQSTGDLRDARDAVRDEAGYAELTAALDDLVDALTIASAGPLDDESTERIADGLAAVGRHAQPVCEFPS